MFRVVYSLEFGEQVHGYCPQGDKNHEGKDVEPIIKRKKLLFQPVNLFFIDFFFILLLHSSRLRFLQDLEFVQSGLGDLREK